MGTRGFERAAERWLALIESESEEDCAELLAIEQEILNFAPTTTTEVVMMLKVLAISLEGDVRSDGADVEALHRIARSVSSPGFKWSAAA